MRNEAFKEQEKLSLIEVLIELPYFIAVVFMAIFSGSLILILDVFETAGVIAQSGMAFGLSRKLRGSGAFQYDFGMGKIEAFGGFISAILLFMGLIIVLVFSIGELLAPSPAGDILLWAVFLKVFCVGLAVWLHIKQHKAAKSIDSSFMQANLTSSGKVLVFDTVALATISVSYFFREIPYVEYVEPIICIACVCWFAVVGIKNLRAIIPELLDRTLGEKQQMQILKCVTEISGGIAGFGGIRTRRSGHLIYIDLLVSFDSDVPYGEICGLLAKFDKAVKNVLPDSISAVVISTPRDTAAV
ncbi:MAG: cation transporter [Defluviitaleaceae bacterium]|nr:cation transporter [Defluviitaleaceae bacterium]